MQKRVLRKNRVAGHFKKEKRTIKKNKVAVYSNREEKIKSVNKVISKINFLDSGIIKCNWQKKKKMKL